MNYYDAQRRPVNFGALVGRGGEAAVYPLRDNPDRLVKLYEPAPRPDYAAKLAWMVQHPPENPTQALAHASLAWPDGLVWDANRAFKGYTMPRIAPSAPIWEIFNPRQRAAAKPFFRFDRRYLLRTARNLAAAMSALHRSGYVAGDINESNVLVTPKALVTLIDTDSFQVREERGGQPVWHLCPVGKPEYTPPELQGKLLSQTPRTPDQDNFGLAVLIFQLLMDGSHPFRSLWLADGEPPALEAKIAQGAYPYTAHPSAPVAPPPNSPSMDTLPLMVAELFERCFVDGHRDPRWRPGPDLWERVLRDAEKHQILCAQGHIYDHHLAHCPECERAARRAGTHPAGGFQRPPLRGASPSSTTAAANATSANAASAAANAASRRVPPSFGHAASANAASANAASANAASANAASAQAAPAAAASANAASANAARPVASGAGGLFRGLAGTARVVRTPRGASVSIPTRWPLVPRLTFSLPRGWGARLSTPPSVMPGVLHSRRPIMQPGALRFWARHNALKSIRVGGGQGALAGALPGALIGVVTLTSPNGLPWPLLTALGGAAGGLLRGWNPGQRMAALIDHYLGWQVFWMIFGTLAGAAFGGAFGLLLVWLIWPLFLLPLLGGYAGYRLGQKIHAAGSFFGWQRVWGVLSAFGFAALGFGLARLLGLAGLDAFGANLSTGLQPFTTDPSWTWTVLWVAAAASGGALCGALAGILTDLLGRFTGLVD